MIRTSSEVAPPSVADDPIRRSEEVVAGHEEGLADVPVRLQAKALDAREQAPVGNATLAVQTCPHSIEAARTDESTLALALREAPLLLVQSIDRSAHSSRAQRQCFVPSSSSRRS